MADKTKPDAPKVPTFQPVPITELPEGVKRASADTIALGAAILAQTAEGMAARDPETYADRAAATVRAGQLKRAVLAAGIPADKRATMRIYPEDGVYRIAVAITDAPAAAPATTDAPAEGESVE